LHLGAERAGQPASRGDGPLGELRAIEGHQQVERKGQVGRPLCCSAHVVTSLAAPLRRLQLE
jgi:hypothetical protein